MVMANPVIQGMMARNAGPNLTNGCAVKSSYSRSLQIEIRHYLTIYTLASFHIEKKILISF